ncbi:MAG: hypothetical protein AAGD25_24160 [Cyanobacteria bacterium P01_F01_bin.150]
MIFRLLPISISSSLVLAGSLFGLNFAKDVAHAQTTNEFAQQIRTQLDILADSSQFEQYQPILTHIDDIGLNVGESRDWDLPVEANVEYVVAAVCDNDCQNIDLELLEGDRVVDADREEGPYPIIVGITGEHSYRAKIIMRACAVNPCYSGFRLFKLK